MASQTIKIYYSEDIEEVVKWSELFGQHLQLIFHSYISKETFFSTQLASRDSDFGGAICIAGDEHSIEPFRSKLSDASLHALISLDDFDISFAKHPIPFFEEINKESYVLDSNSELTAGLYWQKLIDFAFSLGAKTFDVAQNNLSVYLGETGKDQLHNRDIVRRELTQLGYTVLPKSKLPDSDSEAIEEISSALEKSCAVILFVGTDVGRIVGSHTTGVVEYQYAVIQEHVHNQDRHVPVMLWFADLKQFQTDAQLSYLQRMQRSVDLGAGTELIQMPIEKFKQVAIHRINSYLAKDIHKIAADGKDRWYVIGEVETEKYKNITAMLAQNAIVLEQEKDSTPSLMLSRHRNYLTQADCVAICYDHQTDDWLRAKLQDVLKSPGFGRKTPFKHVVIVSATGVQIGSPLLNQYNEILPLLAVDYADTSALQKILKNS